MSKDTKRNDPTTSAAKDNIKPTTPQTQTQGNTAIAMSVQNQPTEVKEWTDQEKDAAVKQHGSWSGVFRALEAQNYTRSQISKLTGKRYQHVRNVLIVPIGKQAQQTTETAQTTEKKND